MWGSTWSGYSISTSRHLYDSGALKIKYYPVHTKTLHGTFGISRLNGPSPDNPLEALFGLWGSNSLEDITCPGNRWSPLVPPPLIPISWKHCSISPSTGLILLTSAIMRKVRSAPPRAPPGREVEGVSVPPLLPFTSPALHLHCHHCSHLVSRHSRARMWGVRLWVAREMDWVCCCRLVMQGPCVMLKPFK
jgi:hypothetical protein